MNFKYSFKKVLRQVLMGYAQRMITIIDILTRLNEVWKSVYNSAKKCWRINIKKSCFFPNKFHTVVECVFPTQPVDKRLFLMNIF